MSYERKTTPLVPNALAAEYALRDITALADAEDASVIAAEDLAVSGPADGAIELTPTRRGACRECGGQVTPVGSEWTAPADADEAWREWRAACVCSIHFCFCPVTGGMWKSGIRYDLERRKNTAKPRPWDGVERRHTRKD